MGGSRFRHWRRYWRWRGGGGGGGGGGRVRARELGVGAPAAIGVYPETKHPSYFAERGLAMEELLVATLERYGYEGPEGGAFLQSFETGNLKADRKSTRL